VLTKQPIKSGGVAGKGSAASKKKRSAAKQGRERPFLLLAARR
jgi:hypothetical protein